MNFFSFKKESKPEKRFKKVDLNVFVWVGYDPKTEELYTIHKNGAHNIHKRIIRIKPQEKKQNKQAFDIIEGECYNAG